MLNVFALQTSSLLLASMVMLALFVGLLGPYLVEEIRRGKADFGPGIPLGAADPQPGYRGNPLPGRSVPQAAPDLATLSLRSFHIVLILLSVVLASGTGMWALRHQKDLLGVISFAAALFLLMYGGYFVRKTATDHLK